MILESQNEEVFAMRDSIEVYKVKQARFDEQTPEVIRYRRSRRRFKNLAKVMSFGNLLMMLWYMMNLHYFEFGFFLFQGVFICYYLIFAYLNIYHRFLSYHEAILRHHGKSYTRKEVALVRSSNHEVRVFFAYIIALLFVESLFLAINAIDVLTQGEWGDRLQDIAQIMLTGN